MYKMMKITTGGGIMIYALTAVEVFLLISSFLEFIHINTIILQILFGMMVIDIITGIIKSIIEGKVSSSIASIGLLRKMAVLATIPFVFNLDMLVPFPTAFGSMSIVLGIWTESISILENLEKIGVPMPDIIRKRVDSMVNPKTMEINEEIAIKLDIMKDEQNNRRIR